MDADIAVVGKQKARMESCSFSGLIERLVDQYNPRIPTPEDRKQFVKRKRGRPRKLDMDDVDKDILSRPYYANALGLPTKYDLEAQEKIEIPVARDTGYDEPEPLHFGC